MRNLLGLGVAVLVMVGCSTVSSPNAARDVRVQGATLYADQPLLIQAYDVRFDRWSTVGRTRTAVEPYSDETPVYLFSEDVHLGDYPGLMSFHTYRLRIVSEDGFAVQRIDMDCFVERSAELAPVQAVAACLSGETDHLVEFVPYGPSNRWRHVYASEVSRDFVERTFAPPDCDCHLGENCVQGEVPDPTCERGWDETEAPSRVGTHAYNFTLPDQYDNDVELAQFYGRYTIIALSGVECGPCRREVPHLQQAARNNPDIQIVEMLVVGSLGSGVGGAQQYDAANWARSYDITEFPVLAEETEAISGLHNTREGTPTHIVLSPEMEVLGRVSLGIEASLEIVRNHARGE